MEEVSTYSERIIQSNSAFQVSVDIYRAAVDFFIKVADTEWPALSTLQSDKARLECGSCGVSRWRLSLDRMVETQSDAPKGQPSVRTAIGSTRIYSCEASHVASYCKKKDLSLTV